jgi:hypothetical protein
MNHHNKKRCQSQFFELHVETYVNLLLAIEAVWSKICRFGLITMRKDHFWTFNFFHPTKSIVPINVGGLKNSQNIYPPLL